MEDKIIYSCKAPEKVVKKVNMLAFLLLTAAAAIALIVLSRLPYSGITTVLVIFFFAGGIYSLMKKSLFDITYVLYGDRLVYLRRYGALEKENEVFPLDEAKFFRDKILFRGKTYEFCPDERLQKELSV